MKQDCKKYKFIIHVSMSRAGSGFLCSLLDGHPSIFIPYFDNENQGAIASILKNKKSSFEEKREKVLSHLKSKNSRGRYIYYGMHVANKTEIDFLGLLGDCKIIISVRDSISSFCSRLAYEYKFNKGFIPTIHFHSLTINSIISSKFDYTNYDTYEVLLPTLHLNPKNTLQHLCIFLKINFNASMLTGTKFSKEWKPTPIESLGGIKDSNFDFTRYIERSKKVLLSYRTQCFIYLISKDFYSQIKVLRNYSYDDTLRFKKNISTYLFSIFMINDLDKKIYQTIPKKFFFLNIVSYFSFRYYLLLSFLRINKSKFYNFSPYVLSYLILERLKFNKNKFF